MITTCLDCSPEVIGETRRPFFTKSYLQEKKASLEKSIPLKFGTLTKTAKPSKRTKETSTRVTRSSKKTTREQEDQSIAPSTEAPQPDTDAQDNASLICVLEQLYWGGQPRVFQWTHL